MPLQLLVYWCQNTLSATVEQQHWEIDLSFTQVTTIFSLLFEADDSMQWTSRWPHQCWWSSPSSLEELHHRGTQWFLFSETSVHDYFYVLVVLFFFLFFVGRFDFTFDGGKSVLTINAIYFLQCILSASFCMCVPTMHFMSDLKRCARAPVCM